MTRLLSHIREQIDPLDCVASFNVIGSGATQTRYGKNDEIDLYVLLDTTTPEKVTALTSLLETCKVVLEVLPYIELRRGPFRDRNVFQFHLIIDDLNSIKNTSPITLADWARTALLLKGTPIDRYINTKVLHKSFLSEIGKTIHMLTSGNIVYKKWDTNNGIAVLRNHVVAPRAVHEYLELLKYAYKAMRADYLALSRDDGAGSVYDRKIVTMIDDFKSGRLHRLSIDVFLNAAIGWDRELASIAQKDLLITASSVR